MLCLVFNIENPLNYDVGFPYLKEGEVPFPNAYSHKKGCYRDYNLETNEVSESKEIPLYKIRLAGLVKKKGQEDGFVKYKIIQKNNRTGGVFFIFPLSMDRYGRIEAKILDPVTGESLSDWIMENFPEKYDPFRKR